jgi:hypothetical protein
MYSSEILLAFGLNNAGFKLSEQTSDSSVFLNAMRTYSTVNSNIRFSYIDLDYPTSRLTVTGLSTVYCIVFVDVFNRCHMLQ